MKNEIPVHEYLQTIPRPVAAMSKDYPAGYVGYMHSHTRAQLLYAASGSMKLTTEQGSWIVPPQRAVWLPPDYPHQTGSIGPLKMRTLYIRKDVCPAISPDVPRMIRVSPLLRELIFRILAMPQDYDEAGQDHKVIDTFLGEVDWTAIHPVSLPPLKDPRLRKLEGVLAGGRNSTKSLEDWAKFLAISPRTLSRILQKETHLSFQQWRDQIRTFAALPMLAAGKPLVEIAVALGFETAWSFTAMFKRVTGKVPSRYFSM